jgi:hypothetical protein
MGMQKKKNKHHEPFSRGAYLMKKARENEFQDWFFLIPLKGTFSKSGILKKPHIIVRIVYAF